MKRTGALAAILLLTAVPLARADGDPASDVLLAQDVYYTYSPPVSSTLTKALNGLLARARAAGYPMKVALIASAGDLGAYPRLFGKPRRYAELLVSEIAFNSSPHLLVVMPNGLAAENAGADIEGVLSGIRVETGAQSDGLAKAALVGVASIAQANGHPLAIPRIAGIKLGLTHRSAKRSTPSLLLYGGPVLLTAIAASLLLVASRRRAGEEPDAGAGAEATGTRHPREQRRRKGTSP